MRHGPVGSISFKFSIADHSSTPATIPAEISTRCALNETNICVSIKSANTMIAKQ